MALRPALPCSLLLFVAGWLQSVALAPNAIFFILCSSNSGRSPFPRLLPTAAAATATAASARRPFLSSNERRPRGA